MPEQSKSLRDIVSFQAKDTGAAGGMRGHMPSFGGGPGSGLRNKLVFGGAFAVLCAIGAAYLSNLWFESQYDRLRSLANTPQEEPQVVQMETRTVVVAAANIPFGEELTRDRLREIEWPADNLPEGVFGSVGELVDAQQSRYVLAPMTMNEPVLISKVSLPGQRASLSAMLDAGMKAITIRVDDVLGVAGLIRPGDRVDLIWTRSGGSSSNSNDSYTELLLRDIKVLAIDQRVDEGNSDEQSGQAMVARAVTVEVDVLQAQKVALAVSTGKLYLALRHIGEEVAESQRRITMTDLGMRLRSDHRREAPQVSETDREIAANSFGVRMMPASSAEVVEQPAPAQPSTEHYVVVGVRRGLERSEYNVVMTPQ